MRAVRPDLDSGAEALADRVSALERALSGDAAFPRPGAPARGRSAPAPPAGAVPTAGSTPTEEDPAEAAATGTPRDVGRRPSIGALRRSKEAAAAQSGVAEADPPAPALPVVPPTAAARGQRRRRHRQHRQRRSAPERATAPAPGAARPVDRDGLTEAWGDGILQSLPARAKARYASGRFVAVDEQGAHFALPNAAHRDQCVEHQGLVEAALAAHFGTEVRLVLVVDDDARRRQRRQRRQRQQRRRIAPARPGPPAGDASPAEAPPADDDEIVDPAEFVAAGSPAEETAAAEARLLEAFPGASEVAG